MIAAYFILYLIIGLVTVYLRGRAERRLEDNNIRVESASTLAVLILWPFALPFIVLIFGKYRKVK